MSDTHPSNEDPKDMTDPAHPVPEHEPETTGDEVDQDSEPTKNAPDDERPDGLTAGT